MVPVIENTARESELTGRLREAIAKYPQSNAVLVRRHGGWRHGKHEQPSQGTCCPAHAGGLPHCVLHMMP